MSWCRPSAHHFHLPLSGLFGALLAAGLLLLLPGAAAARSASPALLPASPNLMAPLAVQQAEWTGPGAATDDRSARLWCSTATPPWSVHPGGASTTRPRPASSTSKDSPRGAPSTAVAVQYCDSVRIQLACRAGHEPASRKGDLECRDPASVLRSGDHVGCRPGTAARDACAARNMSSGADSRRSHGNWSVRCVRPLARRERGTCST